MAGLEPIDDRPRSVVEGTGTMAVQIVVLVAVCLVAFAIQTVLALVIAVAGAVGIFMFHRKVADKWGAATISLPAGGIEMGGTVTVTLRITGEAASQSPTCTATIECQERATYSQGTDTETATNTLLKNPCPTATRLIDRGLDFVIDVAIPLEGPPSFDLGNNEVVWKLAVDVSTDSPPSLHRSYELDVSPRMHRAQA